MPRKRKTKFAEGSSTPVNDSRNEIEKLLDKYGATGFMYGRDQTREMLSFQLQGRMVQLMIQKPKPSDYTEHGYEAEQRRRWRILAYVVKAKLLFVTEGLATIEEEFLANIVMADGTTMGRWAHPQIEGMYKTGKMPKLLPGGWQP